VTEQSWTSHVNGRSHRAKITQRSKNSGITNDLDQVNSSKHYCQVCQTQFSNTATLKRHINGSKHQQRLHYGSFKAATTQLQSNRHGIEINSGDIEFGTFEHRHELVEHQRFEIACVGKQTVVLKTLHLTVGSEKKGRRPSG
jgi:hypothetical protein